MCPFQESFQNVCRRANNNKVCYPLMLLYQNSAVGCHLAAVGKKYSPKKKRGLKSVPVFVFSYAPAQKNLRNICKMKNLPIFLLHYAVPQKKTVFLRKTVTLGLFLESRFCFFDKLRKSLAVVDCEFCKHFAVDGDVCFFKSVDK